MKTRPDVKRGSAFRLDSCSELRFTLHEFSESLGFAIDAKDSFTEAHSLEVAEVSYVLARCLKLPPCEAEIIHIAGHLHDIGKIGVPDRVLHKRGRLTESEWALMREHPRIGADILRPIRVISGIGIPKMVLHHHERFDGTGYPSGLAGEAIPLGARIISVADSLSAMLGDRPYRPPKSYQEALNEISRCSGTQFDPRVVEALVHHHERVYGVLHDLGSLGDSEREPLESAG